MATYRSDAVGSLLRPAWLVEARQALETGRMSPAEFKHAQVEDRAVDGAIAVQEAAGLDVSAFCWSTMTTALAVSNRSAACWRKPRLETVDELKARIAEATRYIRLERLALSPQCGFALAMEGNEISPDDQRRKLHLPNGARRVELPDAFWVASSGFTVGGLRE